MKISINRNNWEELIADLKLIICVYTSLHVDYKIYENMSSTKQQLELEDEI